MTRTTISTVEETAGVGVLRDLLDGEVVLPGDADWDAARQAWNLSADRRPRLPEELFRATHPIRPALETVAS